MSSTLIFTGNRLTTSPTATSNLFLGLAMYGFLMIAEALGRGGERVIEGNDCRGARAQDEREVEELES